MKITPNYIDLPRSIVDAYLAELFGKVNPILAQDIPVKSMLTLVRAAGYTAEKAVCMHFLDDLLEAGMIEGVSGPLPFEWNRGMQFCYAVSVFHPSLVKSLARGILEGEYYAEYYEYLRALIALHADKNTNELFENVSDEVREVLKDHVLDIVTQNQTLMMGETAILTLSILSRVQANYDEGLPLDLKTFAREFEMLTPHAYLSL